MREAMSTQALWSSKRSPLILVAFFIVLSVTITLFLSISPQQQGFSFAQSKNSGPDQVKLYWLTADGLRADKDLFDMYRWANEGKLPNIKKLMDRGAYGFSVPYFPTLTSNNIATLHTGATSRVHGIVEGAIRLQGKPLESGAINGFSSASKKVDPSWSILEKAGKNTVVLSVPGSTPPELSEGVTIRGRWGNWGFDAPAVIFEPMANYEMRKNTVEDFYFNMIDKSLTRFVETSASRDWDSSHPTSYSEPIEALFEAHGGTLQAHIYDSSNDQEINYDRVLISTEGEAGIADLSEGEWSEWLPVVLKYEEKSVLSQAKVRVIKVWPDGRFRIRVLYNSINNYLAQPSIVANELTENVGPMVDFLDNCLCLGMAPQLVIEPEDKTVALEEARMSWDWHKKAVGYIYDQWKPDVLIQDFYTPNQMLVSKWWLGNVDPNREGYDKEVAQDSWKDLLEMYQGVDAIIGEVLNKADDNTLIVLSAQHGTAPLYRNTRLNNLFAQKGWLKFKIDEKNGKATIDWENSQVVYLKMAHVYINPNGLSGDYKRASGPAYEALREEVIAELNKLNDKGKNPVSRIVKWEDADGLDLPQNGIGDLVLESTIGYRFWEEMTEDKVVFTTPRATGYKEGTNPFEPSMQTPFIIAGPGVKNSIELSKPIRHIDQLPTILRLMDVAIPEYVEGQVIDEVISTPRSLSSM
jgi:predicted AlkP superfamily phosphohydrolase/phosphomutase